MSTEEFLLIKRSHFEDSFRLSPEDIDKLINLREELPLDYVRKNIKEIREQIGNFCRRVLLEEGWGGMERPNFADSIPVHLRISDREELAALFQMINGLAQSLNVDELKEGEGEMHWRNRTSSRKQII